MASLLIFTASSLCALVLKWLKKLLKPPSYMYMYTAYSCAAFWTTMLEMVPCGWPTIFSHHLIIDIIVQNPTMYFLHTQNKSVC